MAKAVGIDLGTTNSVIAAWEGGKAAREGGVVRVTVRDDELHISYQEGDQQTQAA
ncbi:hypothetical protein [Saccharopolyspora sp. 5N708]|uniref:hypothetical protein n=1 Tax=Saccharopolyspora sp. 5N708 TaxID=3457424 RepID=UPI003FD57AFE